MSIESGTKHGDEDGIGGVVTPSHRDSGVVVPSTFGLVSTTTRRNAGAQMLTPCVNLLK